MKMRNPSPSCFIALMTHEAMSINQNAHPDALRNPANPLRPGVPELANVMSLLNNHLTRDLSALAVEMGLEYQPGMLSQSMELNELPALLSDAQFRSE
jgi:hypothetical protein